MSFLSSIGGFFGRVWRGVVGAGRQLAQLLGEVYGRIWGLPDLFLGFLLWPKKYLRIQVRILIQADGKSVASLGDLTASVEYAKRVFKDRLNVELLPYSTAPIIEVMTVPAPATALTVGCGVDARYWILDTGFWMLDSGCWILDAGY